MTLIATPNSVSVSVVFNLPQPHAAHLYMESKSSAVVYSCYIWNVSPEINKCVFERYKLHSSNLLAVKTSGDLLLPVLYLGKLEYTKTNNI